MMKLIIKKELEDIIRSKKFVMAFAVSAVLIILSFYIGANNFFLQQRKYEAAMAENLRQMQGITDWMQVKHHIYLPPNPLYNLINGIQNDIGRDIEMYGVGELIPENSYFNENPLFAIFRFLDLEFLFVIVLSLFAVVFGYNMINGEKESRTLKLVFANALPRDKFILGKLFGAFLAIALPLLIPFLIGCLLLILFGVPMSAASWLKLILILISGMLFFCLFLTLSIFISALTQRSSSSFLILLVIWIFFTLIIPRAAVLLAGRAVEVPSVDEVASRKFRYRSQLFTEEMKKLRAYKAPGTGDVNKMLEEFQQFMANLSDERNKKIDAFNQQINQERQNRQRVQEKLAFSLARISPASVFSLAASGLAGTSIDLKQAYYDAAATYQVVYANFLRTKFDGPLPGAGVVMRITNEGEDVKPIDPTEIPAFEYLEPSLSRILQATAVDFTILIVFNLVFFIGAVVAFLRYDVR